MKALDMLLRILQLLYRANGHLSETPYILELVKSILTIMDDPKSELIKGMLSEISVELKHAIYELLNKIDTGDYDVKSIKQTASVILKDDADILSVFLESIDDSIIDDDKKEDYNKEAIVRLYNALKSELLISNLKKVVNRFAYEVNNKPNTIQNIDTYVEDIITKLKDIKSGKRGNNNIVGEEVHTKDAEAVSALFTEEVSDNLSKYKFKMGLQFLNETSGDGGRLGEMWAVVAAAGKYKTKLALTMFLSMAICNTPPELPNNKKPLLIWGSFEDGLRDVILDAYCFLYKNKHGVGPEVDANGGLSNIRKEEIAAFIDQETSKTGFEVMFVRFKTNNTDFNKLTAYLNDIEKSGNYKILGLVTDYLQKMPTVGCDSDGTAGSSLLDLNNKMRDFVVENNIFYITPHQLGPNGAGMLRAGVDEFDFVNMLPGRGMYAGSSKLDQIWDQEYFSHVVDNGGESYLTIRRGKLKRGGAIVPKKTVYAIYKFEDRFMISPDIGGDRKDHRSVKDIGVEDKSSNFEMF